MADYFTHFSCLLDVGTPERAAAAMAMFQRCRVEDEEADEPQYRGFDLSPQDEGLSGQLWIRDDDGGDPDGVVVFVRAWPTTSIFAVSGDSISHIRPLVPFSGLSAVARR